MDHKIAMTPEEQKAELARRQAAHTARLAQAKREAKTRLETARKVWTRGRSNQSFPDLPPQR